MMLAKEKITASLTMHAYQRLNQRTLMTSEDFFNSFREGCMLYAGKELETGRSHFLFYSPQDREHFFAVMDSGDGEVLTILKSWHHRETDVTTTKADYHKAKLLAERFSKPTMAKRMNSKVTIKAMVLMPDWSRSYKNFGTYRLPLELKDPNTLLNDDKFILLLTKQMKKHRLCLDNIEEIQLKSEDAFFSISWDMLDSHLCQAA